MTGTGDRPKERAFLRWRMFACGLLFVSAGRQVTMGYTGAAACSGDVVRCRGESNFEVLSQRELRDCFPVTLLMVLNHLGRQFQEAGGVVRRWPSYEDVRYQTHRSAFARSLNPESGMVHGKVGIRAANELAKSMGIPWRFEARVATSVWELADALNGGAPVILTWTTKVMSGTEAWLANRALDVVDLPGNLVKGTGEVIEVVPIVGKFIGAPFKWLGSGIKPAKAIVPEGNVYTRYLHASVLLKVDRGQGTFRLANPWAGMFPCFGAGSISVLTRDDLQKNFLTYGTKGDKATRVLREWRELAPPGSYLVAVPR